MTLPNWLSAIVGSPPRSGGLGNSLKARIQNDPYYRFQSLAELRLAADLGIEIDANQATVDDWLRLPGLSIHQARMLTQLSESGVQFLCIEDVATALGVSIQRLQPLSSVLKFYYYDADSVEHLQRVALNTASVAALTQIPGITPTLAKAMLRNRETRGAYKNLVDLQQRLSLSPEAIASLMHYLKF